MNIGLPLKQYNLFKNRGSSVLATYLEFLLYLVEFTVREVWCLQDSGFIPLTVSVGLSWLLTAACHGNSPTACATSVAFKLSYMRV